MILTLKIIICVFSVLIAIGLLCAVVGAALMRKFVMGLRCDPQSDPFSTPFGDMPGFTAEPLSEIAPAVGKDDPVRRSFDLSRPNSAGLALRSDADGGWSLLRSRVVSISVFFKRGRHA